MKKNSFTLDLDGKAVTLETGQLATQATVSVLAKVADTMILATVVEGKVREDLDYFPLTVEYVERLYAGGRIKGSRWVKREGRPSDEAVLTGRLIDRSIRPLFPKEYKNEVQIVITVLSVDGEHEPDVLSILAVSAALGISHIPWNGPVGAVRIGYIQDKTSGLAEFLVNPLTSELAHSNLDMVVTQTKEKTLMIEAKALQISEEVVLEAVKKANAANSKVISFIEKITSEIGEKKTEVVPNNLLLGLMVTLEKSYKQEIIDLIEPRAKKESGGVDSATDGLIEKIIEQEKVEHPDTQLDKKLVAKALESVFYKSIKSNVLKNGKRPDGRKADDIRPISTQVGILPRTHGSALFQRGTTQALTVVTLGSPRLEQLIESAEGEEAKRYIHHYSMPPYSVGETGRMGVPSRREIGHGALAERALEAVIPSQEKFPYTIRVVSEILSSNGSTSMASVCGSTLALMDAGVPIENPVAGIAMGLMSSEKDYVILTDILGLEDFSGDMDFKVAGTKIGITAIQLDVKIDGLTFQQIAEIFEKAKVGRLFILDKMSQTLQAYRPSLSEFAPKIEVIHIPVEKIGEVIGPGGRVIRNIMAQTQATIDVEDDGSITVSGTTEEAVKKAVEWIKGLTREVTVGETFEGEVKRILPFGAFVEILPGKEGMVHVSQMSTGFVKNPSDVVQIGQIVKVRVAEIDEQGRINLSMLFGPEAEGRGRLLDRRGYEAQKRNVALSAPRERTSAPISRPVSEHPLSQQFRRERSASVGRGLSGRPSRFGGPRRGGGRPGGGTSRFRKVHY